MYYKFGNVANASGKGDTSNDAFTNLYPAIVECFAIIIAGYVAGRTNTISSSQARGIGIFVSKFALPALLFKSMCELDFSVVNWKFLASILVSKSIVFVAVLIFTVLLVKKSRWGTAGIFAIFSTQSNDFALGYPIVQAVYENTPHANFIKYIYLVAPISLIFLNPIGFGLLEYQKRKTAPTEDRKKSPLVVVLHVLSSLLLNPIIFMTALGILGNFIFHQKVPVPLYNVLKVLGDAFSASALFCLGLSMVGKIKGQSGVALLPPALLIMAKVLLLPFVTREVVNAMDAGSPNETLDYSMYGFLYGTFPTAPSVFIYASQYGIVADTIATGMVVCTFLSAPLMFVSAKMVMLPAASTASYANLVAETAFHISILGLVCCVWNLGVFILSRRCRSIPHQFTVCIVVSQMLASIGMILWMNTDSSVEWQFYLQFILLYTGIIAARCWTAVLAVALCLLRVRSLCSVLRLRFYLYLAGFGLPVFLSGLLLMVGRRPDKPSHDPTFQFGIPQLIISVVVLSLTIIITIVALVVQTRFERKTSPQPDSQDQVDVDDTDERTPMWRAPGSPVSNCSNSNSRPRPKTNGTQLEQGDQLNCQDCKAGCSVKNIEDIVPHDIAVLDNDDEGSNSSSSSLLQEESAAAKICTAQAGCSDEQRRECTRLIRTYNTIQFGRDEEERKVLQMRDEYQVTRHTVLILLLLLSSCFGWFLCLWKLFNESTGGIYVEIEFVDTFFNYGQGLLLFGVFGLDSQMVIDPFMRRWRKFWYGVENVRVPKPQDLDPETRHTCEQFISYHKDRCKKTIVGERRHRFRTYQDVFTGTEFVDWLIEVGLANDRAEAVEYGSRLLTGSILQHVHQEHNFHDLPYFYQFINEDTDIEA